MMEHPIIRYEKRDYYSFRDNLTDEKALMLLNIINDKCLPDYCFLGTEDDFESYAFNQAMDRAISVLKEKIKKSKEKNNAIQNNDR